jgi:hypothetical protein
VGLGQAAVAGVMQVAAPGGLRDGALDPRAVGVAVAPGRGGLLGAEPALDLVLEAGSEGEMPGVERRPGAAGSVGAGSAVRGAEGHLHDREPVAAGALAPVAGGLAIGAGDLPAVPVDVEPGEVEATLVAGLPATVGRQRTDQLDAVVGAGGRSRTRRSLWGRHGRGRCQPSAHLAALVPAGLLGCGSPGRHTGNRRPARPRWSTPGQVGAGQAGTSVRPGTDTGHCHPDAPQSRNTWRSRTPATVAAYCGHPWQRPWTEQRIAGNPCRDHRTAVSEPHRAAAHGRVSGPDTSLATGHQPDHVCRTPSVRTVVVPEAADGQSADGFGSLQLALLFSRPACGWPPCCGRPRLQRTSTNTPICVFLLERPRRRVSAAHRGGGRLGPRSCPPPVSL